MTSTNRAVMPRRAGMLAAALLLAILGTLPFMATASAHSTQIGSTPAADEVLTTAPTEVVVEFDVPLIDMGSAIAVRGADKESIVTGKPTVKDRFLSVAVDGHASPGEYRVAYRVVSEDGHTISSTFTYTVEGDAPTATATLSSTAAPSPATSAASTPAASPAAADVASPAASSESASDDGGVSPVLIAVGVAFIVILAFGGAIALRR